MKIAFQGEKGAYSDMACRQMFEGVETLPCKTFEDAFDAVTSGAADRAMIPIDNTLAGRVADVYHLLPESGLYIVGEHFVPIHHCLLGKKGASLGGLTHVHSHIHAIPQCRKIIKEMKLEAVVHADTAGAAAEIARGNDVTQAAIASELAAEIYGLNILKANIEDDHRNTTRFVVLSSNSGDVDDQKNVITSFVFEVLHIPSALYKALGGFSTNGVNMIKLESYVDSSFNAARFYCEVEGHPNDKALTLALNELKFFAKDIRIMGSFEKSDFRKSLAQD